MDKKKKILLVLITILIVTICGTFAYFMAQTGDGASANANIKTSSVDDLKFSVSNDLSIVANQFNFAKGEGNLESSATARASLKANNSKNTATYNYYVYFQIESNSYIYTTTGKLPEVVLSITSPNGEVTSIDGLTYVSATNADGTVVKGFDITNLSSTVIKIADNYEITSNSSTNYTNQDWTFKVTFINLDSDQTDNEGKSLKGKVLIQKDKFAEGLADVASNGDNLANSIKLLSQKSITGISNLYYHDSSLENGAGDNSYRYAGGDYILSDAGKAMGVTNIFSTSSTDTSGLIDFYCGTSKSYFGSYCSLSNSYYFLLKNDTTNYSRYSEVIAKALEDGYIKENINNYVCFGSDETTCPVDNLYRIIGVFDGRVKLIKADYATSDLLGTDGDYKEAFSYETSSYKGSLSTSDIDVYYWNYKATGISNTWSTSLLNKINLNTNYLNNIGSKWAEMIDTTTWKVGGNTWENIGRSIPSVAYQNEIVNPATNITYEAKVGLMYASDYGFAAGPSSWIKKLGYDDGNGYLNSSVTSINWMYMGLYESTISPDSSNSNNVFNVLSTGDLQTSIAYLGSSVRPVFYLSSSVKFSSGDGTKSSPYRTY